MNLLLLYSVTQGFAQLMHCVWMLVSLIGAEITQLKNICGNDRKNLNNSSFIAKACLKLKSKKPHISVNTVSLYTLFSHLH